ncbi:nicotinamide-nucleotide amidohydrolase family protein [Pseudoalteromonas sp. MEBiC 03607]|jgi:nicotinamide-nucleotide amidase|uniref:nicotinamide-nucleotide amidohydrolase family protein n=1 Tax=Pseudoalteromonas TaxID=53246 RepID=UPI000EC47D68|nr:MULTISPECIES: nicotinamide-nucleotide amidohydrolase family protein [unclassified Pseudoalteromonas]MCF2919144.1 nicotinamide-nucleotide amidohydrolase family protein [Pseudoalteromonas sp. APAL1]TGV21452.1 nicotinamide-nucleotide amidohydrolase family protein [Pseudoalteromonas sp. MEBiC 03607]HCV05045.1 damage-inducible protein CinA [Pseudoalteromonas sp.]|tara:strand:- start:667 stop:1164 length:498 start_codon:yes stop_codon:yes gene_type:complete
MELHQEIKTLAAKLGAILTDKRLWITTAESCTGGGVSYALTDTPGSSNYIDRAFVTYSNLAKQQLIGVSEQTLNNFGAVSEQTVLEMASGAAKAANADIAIAISGIAGPGGGTLDKPVGLVWFCIHFAGKNYPSEQVFSGDRAEVRLQAIVYSLKTVIELIKSEN